MQSSVLLVPNALKFWLYLQALAVPWAYGKASNKQKCAVELILPYQWLSVAGRYLSFVLKHGIKLSILLFEHTSSKM